MTRKNLVKTVAFLAVVSGGALVACGGEGFGGADEAVDAISGEAAGELAKADGVVSVCPRGTLRVEWDVKRTDAAGRLQPLRISACVSKNAAGQPMANATTPTAPRTTTSDVRSAGTVSSGGTTDSLTCKDYGSIYCCWNSKQGWCVSVNY